jgi:hypothetical protein
MEAINGTGNGRRIGAARSAAHEGGLPLRLTLIGFKGICSGLGRQRLRRLCAKPTTSRGRFQTVAQVA